MARVVKERFLEAEGISVRRLGFAGMTCGKESAEGPEARGAGLEPLARPGAAAPEASGAEGAGEEAGADSEAEWQRQRALVQRVISQLAEERNRLLEETRRQLLEIAMEIGKRVVRAELKADTRVIERVLGEVLDSLSNCQVLKIRVHPSDARLAQAAIHAQDEALAGMQQVELVRDAAVKPGGCVVDTDMGTIDARLEAQFAALEEALLEEATGGK